MSLPSSPVIEVTLASGSLTWNSLLLRQKPPPPNVSDQQAKWNEFIDRVKEAIKKADEEQGSLFITLSENTILIGDMQEFCEVIAGSPVVVVSVARLFRRVRRSPLTRMIIAGYLRSWDGRFDPRRRGARLYSPSVQDHHGTYQSFIHKPLQQRHPGLPRISVSSVRWGLPPTCHFHGDGLENRGD